MPGPLVERLESLSGYRQVFPPSSPEAALNPVVFMHLRLQVAGRVQHILSRIGAAGLDHTHRSNKYAHHVVLDDENLPEGGPAWLLRQPGVMERSWTGPPRLLDAGRVMPAGSRPPAVCSEWAARVGDAGWAGVIAESLMARPERIIFLIFQPGVDLLPLIDEALALLPPERRWRVNFSTYYTSGLPADVPCILRGVLADSDEAKHARRIPDALIINLGERLPAATGGELVELAHTGKPRVVPKPAVERRTPAEPAAPGSPAPPPLKPVEETWDDDGGYGLEPPTLPTGRASFGVPPLPRRGNPAPQDPRSPLRWAMAGSLGTLLVVLGLGGAYWAFQRPRAPQPAPVRSDPGPIVQNSGGQDAPASTGGLQDALERQLEANAAKAPPAPIEKPAAPEGAPKGDGGPKPGEHAAAPPKAEETPSVAETPKVPVPPTPGPVDPATQSTANENVNPPLAAPAQPTRTVRLLQSPLPEPTSAGEWVELQAGEPLAFEPRKLDFSVAPALSYESQTEGTTHTATFRWKDNSPAAKWEPLADFRIKDRRPEFRWRIEHSSKDLQKKTQAVRDALIRVEGKPGEQVSYLLRSRINKPDLTLDLGKRLKDKLVIGGQQIALTKKNYRPGLADTEILTTPGERSEGTPQLWPLVITAVRIDRPGSGTPPLVWPAFGESDEARLRIPPAPDGLAPDAFPGVEVHFIADKKLKGGFVYVVYGEFGPSLEEAVAKINRLAAAQPGSPPTPLPAGVNPAAPALDLKRAQAALQTAYGGQVSFKISALVGEELVEVLRLGRWPEE
jgi:hypothetical protein